MTRDPTASPSAPVFAARGDTAAVEEGTALMPKLDGDGYLAALATDAETGEVLMLAWMNAEALALSIESGVAHFWSRSRGRLWTKGEESGNLLRIVEMRTDCDQDAIWMRVTVEGQGVACHTGRRSCFYRVIPVGRPADAQIVMSHGVPNATAAAVGGQRP